MEELGVGGGCRTKDSVFGGPGESLNYLSSLLHQEFEAVSSHPEKRYEEV